MFSMTVQIDLLRLEWGFYLCQAFYWILSSESGGMLVGLFIDRNHPLEDERAEEKEQSAE